MTEIHQCDALAALRAMPAESVHLVCTSPPYWGLRDYKLPPSVWGGAAGCEHQWCDEVALAGPAQAQGRTSQRKVEANVAEQSARSRNLGAYCSRCSAWRGSLGLEPTIELYVHHLVEIFREVRRVLHPGGTLWLNLGDSYANDSKWGGETGGKHVSALHGNTAVGRLRRATGLKAKDLCEIPSRVALALQADGWYLRARIPWLKRNPMPESVRDRPTSAIEYWFILAKSKRYYWDGEAVRIASVSGDGRKPYGSDGAWALDGRGKWDCGAGAPQNRDASTRAPRNSDWLMESFQGLILDEMGDPLVMLVNPQGYDAQFCAACGRYYDGVDLALIEPVDPQTGQGTRSRRCLCDRSDAWLSHYATYPERCVEPIILAGTSERGCCPQCGEPWRRVAGGNGHETPFRAPSALGWRPGCGCDAGDPLPASVLDPFAGTGTTLAVAERLGRRAIGIELSPDYVRMAEARLAAARREPVTACDEALPLFRDVHL